MSAEVQAVGPDDWQRWRRLRLEAVADTPIGFGETLEQARAVDERGWRQRLARPGTLVLAVRDGVDVGMAGGFLGRGHDVVPEPGDDRVATLFAVHVTPAARGTGMVEALVDAVAAWARERGCPALSLEVHEDNGRARRAYERLAFVPDGRRRPYPLDPSRQLDGLARRL